MTNSEVVANFMRSYLYFSISSACYGFFVRTNWDSNKYVLPKIVIINNAIGFNHFYEYDSLVQSLQDVFVYVILLIRKVGRDRPTE